MQSNFLISWVTIAEDIAEDSWRHSWRHCWRHSWRQSWRHSWRHSRRHSWRHPKATSTTRNSLCRNSKSSGKEACLYLKHLGPKDCRQNSPLRFCSWWIQNSFPFPGPLLGRAAGTIYRYKTDIRCTDILMLTPLVVLLTGTIRTRVLAHTAVPRSRLVSAEVSIRQHSLSAKINNTCPGSCCSSSLTSRFLRIFFCVLAHVTFHYSAGKITSKEKKNSYILFTQKLPKRTVEKTYR